MTFSTPFLAGVVVAPARRRKTRRAAWRELPSAEMAAHLLETPAIADRAWTDEPRLSASDHRASGKRHHAFQERRGVRACSPTTTTTEGGRTCRND